jgi:hypothetical protein
MNVKAKVLLKNVAPRFHGGKTFCFGPPDGEQVDPAVSLLLDTSDLLAEAKMHVGAVYEVTLKLLEGE